MTKLALALALLCAACDPVHDDAIDALGGEAPGVRKGPLHRPGQPCLLCHDGAVGDPPKFTVAGTIYVEANDLTPAVGADVHLTSIDGTTFTSTTNAAGNFYVVPQQFTPEYPIKVDVTYGGVTVKMTANVGRDGSCAGCHFDPAGASSPGHIYVPPDGGTP
jgi:hypothetical protein